MENSKEFKNKIKALLKDDGERKERRRKEEQVGGDDMEDTVFVEEAGSLEDVGKRRKVARQGRLSGSGGGSGGGRLDVEDVIRRLHLFSEEERERCTRPFTVQQ